MWQEETEPMRTIPGAILAAFLCAATAGGAAAETIDVEIWNFSDMDRWIQITDLNCNTVLYQDKMEAQARFPYSLCTDGTGKAKLKFYLRVGCSKNKTIIVEDIEDGATIDF